MAGEPEVAALETVGQAFVVDAHQVKYGGVQVIHVYDVFHGVIAQLVGGAVAGASLNAAAGKPHAEALDMMIAPAALRHRRATEFRAPQDERVFPQTGALEVLDECGATLIHQLGGGLHSALDVAVMIPATVIELNEPHAAFG